MKLKAFTRDNSGDSVKWLVIESDDNDTNGYFIYYYLDENTAFDTWHISLKAAFIAANSQYGINEEDWESLSDD